ncbi:hypothetical protein BAE44_0007749 [Dichanthelium oligosanthes]|uniref:KIB1-4 beta-propeller domain-containing protein n=1 Tax=Dichanthelium oligosanthes TaxID=888268 RepID=A0A1E5W1L4_9POAL|nr:hypothetical protein BAE44_0007749 [Dichanthelium oligosanthes]
MASCSAPATDITPYFPPDLIPKVARRLTSLQDFFALRASCRAYRAVLPLTASNLASQAPLLLLAPDQDQTTESPALFHLSLRRLIRFCLPCTRQDSSYSFFSLGCRVVISYYLRNPSRRELHLVHLLTGEQTRLPSPEGSFNHFVLSGDLLITWGYFGVTIRFCRLGATDWSVASIRGSYVLDCMICVKGTIYALVSTGYDFDNPVYLLAAVNLSDSKCHGELILVITMEFNPNVYHVFQWKSGEAKWVRITSLGGCALFFALSYFVGCLEPDHPGIRKDCIYFNDEGLWSEYSSVDGSFRRSDAVYPEGKLQKGFRAPVWVFPSMC